VSGSTPAADPPRTYLHVAKVGVAFMVFRVVRGDDGKEEGFRLSATLPGGMGLFRSKIAGNKVARAEAARTGEALDP
jgi:hypothetical protein